MWAARTPVFEVDCFQDVKNCEDNIMQRFWRGEAENTCVGRKSDFEEAEDMSDISDSF
jgi:hypothetical protein